MTFDQLLAFGIVTGMMALFVWGRLRYDLVAGLALLASVVVGVVPFEAAFAASATSLTNVAHLLPPYGALALIMVAAMALTPFLNNAATVLVMAPIAASVAGRLGFQPDAFLMAVAVGAACDFLTPIGHQCNTLVMGPGG